jgi:hypothetical protein
MAKNDIRVYESLGKINLKNFASSSDSGCWVYATLDYVLSGLDSVGPVKNRIPVACMTQEEWEMLKYAQWLITRHKLDKADQKALQGYGEGKKIFDDVVSGRYGERLNEEKKKKEAKKAAEKQGSRGILTYL